MQALSVGSYQGETYFPETKFDVEFTNPVTIKVTSLKDSASTFTTIYNAIQWLEIPGQPVDIKRRGPGEGATDPAQPVFVPAPTKVEEDVVIDDTDIEGSADPAQPVETYPKPSKEAPRRASKARGVLDDDDIG